MAEYEWAQITLGQNAKIAEVASAAGKASSLVDANVKFAKTALELGKVLLLAATNPQLILLVAIADEIDNFVNDLKSTGIFVLEVVPAGTEVLPKDADGNPVKLVIGAVGIAASYTAAAAGGLTKEFIAWSTEFLGEPNPELGLSKSKYEVSVGKSLPDGRLDGKLSDDNLSDRDSLLGFDKMTPSQVIATMIAAMDDEDDKENKPNFSDSADVAAIIVIVGFTDMRKNLKSLKEVIGLFVAFFGGENGLFTKGFKTIFESMGEAIASLDDTESLTSEIIVESVCGVRGTTEDRKVLRQIIPQSQWNEFATDASAYYYNFPAVFEVGDLIVGPFAKFDGRAIGIVKEIKDNDDAGNKQNENSALVGAPYVTQTLVISCLGVGDKGAFDTIGTGSVIQKVSYFKNRRSHVDNNSGEVIEGKPFNDYKYIKDLTETEAISVAKVKRESGSFLLKEFDPSSVLETHGGSFESRRSGVKTKNHVQGVIQRTKAASKIGVHPNFKKAKLETLIQELGGFFAQIENFTKKLRSFAKASAESIEKIIGFINTMIKQLDELNKAIQAILKIFTTGLPDSGVYSLSIPSTTGGNNAIKSALSSAANGPPNSLDYSVGFMIMGGAAAIDPLLSLISG